MGQSTARFAGQSNQVELIGTYGGDTTHALSAWTSTSRELTPEKEARIPDLLKFLALNRHYTPFEKSFLHFLVVCDTASHIHFLKHRIGVSINGESARYKELKEDKFYIPYDWSSDVQDAFSEKVQEAHQMYHSLIEFLSPILGRKRAKESARFILPYSNQVTLDISFNFKSFMHFQELRNADDAQVEIRGLAETMLNLIRNTGAFKYSLVAFGK